MLRSGVLQRDLERTTNQYWLKEFLRREVGTRLHAIVLGDARGQVRSTLSKLLGRTSDFVPHKW